MKPIKVIVEKHPDGYIAYPLGLKGVVVGQGDTYEEAMADVKSAISFHIETFGPGRWRLPLQKCRVRFTHHHAKQSFANNCHSNA